MDSDDAVKSDSLDIHVGWRSRPESAEAVARRFHRMLVALAAIDERFTGLLVGGRGPNPKKGWKPLEVSEEAILKLVLASDRNGAHPKPGDMIIWGFAAWNGRPEKEGSAVGMSMNAEGPIPWPIPLRSYADIGCRTDGLTVDQVAAIKAALFEAWDPEDAKLKERVDGDERSRRWTREGGWQDAD
jgi:hypothetical protein